MNIRRAEKKDIPGVLELLVQVLKVHAERRPDLFIAGATKYSAAELEKLFKDDSRPVYVAVDNEKILGYLFCEIEEKSYSGGRVEFRSLYLDDLCVDEDIRERHIGRQLFEHAKKEAKRLGCHEITLNVWEGNDAARAFYDRMGMKVQKTCMEYKLD
jgi:ribosomal protein S18 acetylase RimI-like enzyme